jgi:hypothetical protein
MANQVEITITADPKNAEAGFKKTQTSFGKMADGIRRHRKAIGVGLTAIGAGITALGVSAIKSSLDQRVGIAQLDVALQNVGTSYDEQAAAIERVIAAQQNKTNFGDEAQREALMDLISVSGDYEQAMAALPAVLDLAAGKGMDLSAASTLVARAISGEESALKRYGIAVEKGATATEVITAIMAKFGGQAEASADPMTQLKNRVGDLFQVLGDMLLPAMERLAILAEKAVRRVIAWTDAHPVLTKVLMIVVGALGALALVLGPILIMLPTLAAGMALLAGASGIGALVVAVGVIAAGAMLLWKNWNFVWTKMKEITEVSVNFIIGLFNKMTAVQRTVLAGMIDAAKKFIDALPGGNPLGEAMEKASAAIRAGIPDIDITTAKLEGFGAAADVAGWRVAESIGAMASHANSPTVGFPGIARAAENAAKRISDSMADELAATGEAYNIFLEDRIAAEKKIEALRTALAEKVAVDRLQIVTDSMDDELAAFGEFYIAGLRQDQQYSDDMIAHAQLVADTIHRVNREAAVENERIAAESARNMEAITNRVTRFWDRVAGKLDPVLSRLRAFGLDAAGIIKVWADETQRDSSEIIDYLRGLGEEADTLKEVWGLAFDKLGLSIDETAARLISLAGVAKNTTSVVRTAGGDAGGNGSGGRGPSKQEIQASIESIGQQMNANPTPAIRATLQNALDFLLAQRKELYGLAQGGIVNRPTVAMLGESGPEAVIPLGRGGGAGAGAGMTINLVINGDVQGMDDFEAKVTSVIRDAVLGGGFQGVLARA